MTSLGTIADVRMGVTLRGRDATRPNPRGSCRMIRISDLTNDGHLANPDLVQFEPSESIKPDLFLRPGDVLFPNRGTRTTAYVFNLPDTNVIVGAQFFIIRANPRFALPEFIAWFLRSEKASQHFHLRRKGTLVQTVQRRDIQEVDVPLPGLEKQSTIVALDALTVQEYHISSKIAELRSIYLQRFLLQSSQQT